MKVWYMCLSACLIATVSILDVAAQGSRGRKKGRPPIAEPTSREKLPSERIIEELTGAMADRKAREEILANYIVETVADANIPNDPLLIDAKKLQEPEGLETLRQYLDRQFGQRAEEEKDEILK